MNRQDLIHHIASEFDEQRALGTAVHMTQFYRSPGSEGYHRATDFVHKVLDENNLDKVWVERFPLDGETKFLNQKMPMSWEPYSAELRLSSSEGELLVSYESAYSCLPWWTQPTPEGGVTLDVVDVGTGENEEDYTKKDVKGKIAFIRGTTRPTGFAHAANLAMAAGVAGIITDYLLYQTAPFRTRESLPEPVQLLRMPSQQFNNCWAIVVNYHAAERLSAQIAKGFNKVFCDIKCRSFKGEAQNLLADIEGTDKKDEFIQFVCHSTAGTRPGSNCASGPAVLAEMGRTIKSLIDSGRIPRPSRSIRFLINVEGHGTKNYITNHREDLGKTQVVIALDSVGHDQRKCFSALMFYHSPDSLPTYVNDFYVSIMEAAPKETRWVFNSENNIPFVNFTDLPYTPWSDNKYYPVFGIPSPLIMSWPDLYFHTSMLTPDKLDPQVMRRCGITTAIAALELAYAGPGEAKDIMRTVATRSQYRLNQIAIGAKGTKDEGRVRRRLALLAKRDQLAVASAINLTNEKEQAENPELNTTSERLQQDIADTLKEVSSLLQDEQEMEFPAGNVVPKRMVERDPPGLAGTPYWDLYQMTEEMKQRDSKMIYDSIRVIADEAWNWADGKRTVNEITAGIGAEFDFDLEGRHILKLFQGLESKGLVSFS
jgi:hypothetical protein